MKRRFGRVWPYVTFFVVMLVSTFAYIVYYLPVNKDKYMRLVTRSTSVSSDMHTVKQIRHQTQKDIFFLKKNTRLQLRVKAENAELKFVTSNRNTSVVEQMFDVTCLMQEELYYLLPDGQEAFVQPNGKLCLRDADPNVKSSWVTLKDDYKPMQIIRYMESDDAVYYYKDDTLIANKVQLARYVIPGHQLCESIDGYEPNMSGFAKSVKVAKVGKEYTFEAQKLKMGIE